ncbi:sensor histidine kinase [Arthrobacter halodurans]|uniref:histidine kinase n=1 Tax=Arthrobacter halodurans TaxID=516699 RepID=A0ABV4UIY2_9MICC
MTAAQPMEGSGTPDVTFAELAERRRGPIRRFARDRPVAADVAVCAAYLLLSTGAVLTSIEHGHWVPAAGVAVVAVLLFFRRRRSLAVLVAVLFVETGILLDDPLFTLNSVGLWVALYTSATQYSARRMFAMGGLASAVQILLLLFWVLPATASPDAEHRELSRALGNPSDVMLLLAALLLVFDMVAVGIGAAVRNNRLHDAELANWGRRVQALAQTAERNRIAREMHDVVAHSLSVMIALSDGAAVVVRRDPDRAAEVLTKLSATGRGALADMRRVIGVLRDGGNAPLEPQPASSSLNAMLEGFRVAGVPLRFEQTGPALPEDAAFQLTVYRIIQESLTNVLRYGRGVTRVAVALSREDDTVRIKVADNGQPPPTPRETIGSGQGLKGIAERTAIYGGSVYAGPGPQGGWVVHAILAVPDGEAAHGSSKGEETDEHADAR